jgi:uncharacterized protein (DUF486 family)
VLTSRIVPVLLLLVSNVFMTFAWYAHLKRHQTTSLGVVIVVSWAIAFFEYALQVPANRLGFASGYSLAQLKTIQEVITLLVFLGFSTLYFGTSVTWNQLVGFAFIALGAVFVFKPW